MDGRLGPTSLSEVRRGLAGALRAEADEASLPRSGTARSPNAPIHRSSARRRSWKGVWIALVATVGFLALQVTVWHLSPLRTRPLDISVADTPASGETYYLAHDRGGHLDHHVLFHGLDDRAMERLRDAQVLFLGNSRMMFALDRQTLRGVLSRLGISYYVLGFGHDETAEFPMALIERHDIRPAVVVVNADNFFTGQPSAFANEVMGDSWFDAMKWRVEGIAAHSVRRALHHVIPHWPVLVLEEREFVIAFRKGHRIMVQVQSTWFPVIDRNPQTFVPNIFEAKAADYQKTTQRIYRSKPYPSNVRVAVVQGS